jgi:transposase
VGSSIPRRVGVMAGRSPLSATVEQEAALRELARSDIRGEADRARAILLTLSGWTSERLAEVFGVTADSVRHWRQWFSEGGVEALRSTLAPGPSPAKGERALAVASAVLSEPVQDRLNWTLPRLRAEIERQTGVSISKSRLSILLREKGGSLAAPAAHAERPPGRGRRRSHWSAPAAARGSGAGRRHRAALRR